MYAPQVDETRTYSISQRHETALCLLAETRGTEAHDLFAFHTHGEVANLLLRVGLDHVLHAQVDRCHDDLHQVHEQEDH